MSAGLQVSRIVDGEWIVKTVQTDERFFLNRSFLRGRRSATDVPRQVNAPELFFAADGWLLFNRSERAINLTRPGGAMRVVPAGLLSWLDAGRTVLQLYGVQVQVRTSQARDEQIEEGDGPVTQTDAPARVERILELMGKNHLFRRVLAARFQLYFLDYELRRPLTAHETAGCSQLLTAAEINNLQSRIKHHTNLDLLDVGPFLREHGIIREMDVLDLVHEHCYHDW